jgi:uncharacterized protein
MHTAVFAAVLMGGLGCSLTGGSDPVQFYVLTSQAEQTDRPPVTAEGLSIGVGPIDFPEYLVRPQLVTRLSDTELRLDEFSRWAEPIEDGFARSIGDNLVVLLGATVMDYPWYSTRAPDFAVSIDVVRFELTAAGTASLISRWEITRPATRERLFFKESVLSQPVDSAGAVSTAVAALSRVMDQLSQEIAEELRRVGTGN